MASSTSSSEPRAFEREVPKLAWGRAGALAAVLAVGAMVGWELEMRSLGLRAGDLGDGVDHWATERRKVDEGPCDSVVLVGSSRILFDTDLDVWQEITGRRPIQLALQGTPPNAFLTDIADDEHFAGVVVVGVTDTQFFGGRAGLFGKALAHARTQSPSQRSGHALHEELSRHVAFLDDNYSLFALLERRRIPNRGTIEGPYADVWKLSENLGDRQTVMWSRIETDPYLREHARLAWHDFKGVPAPDDVIAKTVAQATRDAEKIRARGGDVVFVRSPSGGPVRENERIRVPREKGWDVLLRETRSRGVHFEDYAEMQGLDTPEWSHLTRASATRFTSAYVTALVKDLPRLVAASRQP